MMCNDAIRIAIEQRPRSRFKLIQLAYPRLKEYGLHTHYILTACEVAYSTYRNKNRKTNPHIRKAFLKLDGQSCVLNHLLLRIPRKPRQFIFLTLRGSDYHTSFIEGPSLRRGSITVTGRAVSIAFSKETAEVAPRGQIGVDVNERNITTSDILGNNKVYDTSEVSEIRERYRDARARIGTKTGKDNRISQRLYEKYGRRERNRTVQRIHRVSKAVVQDAREREFGIVLEKLKGIRRLYRKGNGQGSSFRGRMNSWMFHEFQRQVVYKAAWLGVPVTYVNPRGSSSNCPDCGSCVAPRQKRKLYCVRCDKTWDRDDLASKNLTACAVPQVRPPGRSCEGEPRMQEDAGNPQSRWTEGRFDG